MSFCPNCGTNLPDNATFCINCGNPVSSAPIGGYTNVPTYTPVAVDPYDHTAEFDPKDISDNKVVCMLIYLAGYVGILVALLLAGTSPYVGFHLRQALKIEVANMLLTVIAIVGAVLLFIPSIVAGCLMLALLVVKFICFFQICGGKAKEAPIVRGLGFMK